MPIVLERGRGLVTSLLLRVHAFTTAATAASWLLFHRSSYGGYSSPPAAMLPVEQQTAMATPSDL